LGLITAANKEKIMNTGYNSQIKELNFAWNFKINSLRFSFLFFV
jgi:hypothetical protein